MHQRPARFLSAWIGKLITGFFLVAISSANVFGQLEGKLAEEPFGIGYVRDFKPGRILGYAMQLSKRLDIGAEMMKEVPVDDLKNMESSIPGAVDGVAWYMVQGLIPSFQWVSFRQVSDEAEALRLLNFRAKQYGENASLSTEDNGRFTLTNHWSWKNELAAGQNEADLTRVQSNLPAGFQQSVKVIEEDGKRFVEHTQTMTVYYRLHDGLLFECSRKELQDMKLPSAGSLLDVAAGESDMGLGVFPERIPAGMKQLGWNMLNSGISAQIQQRDGENDSLYNMRHSSAEIGLNLVQAALFDTDSISGRLRFAHASAASLNGELKVLARKNSRLTKTLEDAASGRSRFAPILRDDAAATIHLCVRFPEESQKLLQSAGQWLQEVIAEESGRQPEMMAASVGLSQMLTGMAEHRTLEILLKVGWTRQSAGVIYGGLQVDAESPLAKSLHDLMTRIPNAPADIISAISLIQDGSQPYIRIVLPQEIQTALKNEQSLSLSHLYLTHQNSCLWFALGGENSIDIIRQSLARCSESGYVSRTPLVSAKIDLQKWLAYPQDDPTGIAGWPLWLDQNAAWFPPSPIMISRNFGNSEAKPSAVLQRVFELGGEQEASLRIDADDSGILVSASLGEAIGNYYLARMISWEESRIQQQREAQKRQETELKAAAEKAQQPQPAP